MLVRILLHFSLFFLYTNQVYSAIAISQTDTIKKKKRNNTFFCLEVRGNLFHGDEKLDSLDVTVYKDGEIIDKYNTEGEKLISVGFFHDMNYSLVIKRKGFVPLLIIINTDIKNFDEEEDKLYRFYFDTNMIPENNELNHDFLDYPAAYLRYSAKEDAFNISDKYNRFIKSSLKIK